MRGVFLLPSQTFFNLPEKKKQTLILAAKKEFSRVSIGEASIANIVKEANIPRGSFYQYFEDKEDLYFYLLNENAKDRKQELIQAFRENKGDIFKSIDKVFHSLLLEMEDIDVQNFYRNVFLNMNYKTEKAFLSNMNFDGFNEQFNVIKPLINKRELNIETENDLFHIVQIISTIMMNSLIRKFAKNLSNEEVIKGYTTQINLLKKGVIRRN